MTDHRKNQRAQILGLLIRAKGEWVPLPAILDLKISQYGARIYELRKLGHVIQNKSETDAETGVRHSYFRLGSLIAVPKSKPEPAWEERPRVTGLPLFDAAERRP